MRFIKGKRDEEEQRKVSPAIPFHIIHDPSLLINLDLCASAGSSKQNPLDMLARQAVQTFENTNQAQLLTFPNRCSYKRCGAPLDSAYSCLGGGGSPRWWPSSIRGAPADCCLGSLGRWCPPPPPPSPSMMSNPGECHWTDRQEVRKIAKSELCKLFCYRFP